MNWGGVTNFFANDLRSEKVVRSPASKVVGEKLVANDVDAFWH